MTPSEKFAWILVVGLYLGGAYMTRLMMKTAEMAGLLDLKAPSLGAKKAGMVIISSIWFFLILTPTWRKTGVQELPPK